MFDTVARRFREVIPTGVDFCSLRLSEERQETVTARRGVVQPIGESVDRGAMITVVRGKGSGYAATSDLSVAGLREAADRASRWAQVSAALSVFDAKALDRAHPRGSWASPVARSWDDLPLPERIERVRAGGEGLGGKPRVVDWASSVSSLHQDTLYLTDGGGELRQTQHILMPDLAVIANEGRVTQRRTLGGGRGATQQGGEEVLERIGFDTLGPQLRDEALALLDAPECPSGRMDLLLDPDQMMLQIHESIGHPLELDRILGDERNYAGTSFVTKEMFGTYRYGSELLNVTFDPELPEELGTYAWDDDGTPATREWLIRDGILVRPLGGAISQQRAGMAGVANSRASSWNRPPIDRMANLHIEAGDHSFDRLVSRIERGVYMQTNLSWSIDDSRNKFQFGCEFARLIEDGKLTKVVRNPNYRGISATFWRSLAGVGDASTRRTYGTPFCGKGEPNQIIRVGHASPACLFAGVEVFGGES